MLPDTSFCDVPRNAAPPPFFTKVLPTKAAFDSSFTITASNRLLVMTFRSRRTVDLPATLTPWSLSWMKLLRMTAWELANCTPVVSRHPHPCWVRTNSTSQRTRITAQYRLTENSIGIGISGIIRPDGSRNPPQPFSRMARF